MLQGRHDVHTYGDDIPLYCAVDVCDDTAYVRPVGELDIATVPLVDKRLVQARAPGVSRVILDLRGVTFIDSTGLHLALAWHQRARSERFGFALIQGPEPVRRTIDLAGIARAFTFVE